MKQIAFITLAVLLLAACEKDPTPTPQPQPDPEPTVSLAGTSWMGTYNDNYQGYPATLTWSLDFFTDSTGSIFLDFVIAAQPQPSVEVNFHYTLNGTEGNLYTNDSPEPEPFTYDTISHTITIAIKVTDGVTSLGGTTTFYPQGEVHNIFPVNTKWMAEQQLTVSDTLMPVEWGLDFWEYGWGGQINYCANGTCCGTSLLWQYDSTAHTGFIRINGSQHPFTYDPSTDILTLDYSTHIYGTTVTIGGTLQFRRKADLKKDSSPVHNGKTAPTIQNTFHIL